MEMGLNMGYVYPLGVLEDMLGVTRKHFTEPLEPWTSSDPRFHEDLLSAGMSETR
jgi:hypothetical protein